jgi:hypothetical protein
VRPRVGLALLPKLLVRPDLQHPGGLPVLLATHFLASLTLGPHPRTSGLQGAEPRRGQVQVS